MARTLYVTSPLTYGADVLLVQQQLAALGYTFGKLDTYYGPATASAVRSFQGDQKLEADGVVGPLTLAALANPKPKPAPQQSALGVKALAKANEYIGVKEAPPGSNNTQFGEWFGANGCAWCNIFVSFCFVQGASYVIADGYPGGHGAGVFAGKGCSYVPTTERWLKASGMWLGRVQPLPGDIAIYNWDGGEPDHIGIVSAWVGKGDFDAIEGNTSDGNDSNGGEVMLRRRHLTNVDGFGRIPG